jgi:hypothetical protein
MLESRIIMVVPIVLPAKVVQLLGMIAKGLIVNDLTRIARTAQVFNDSYPLARQHSFGTSARCGGKVVSTTVRHALTRWDETRNYNQLHSARAPRVAPPQPNITPAVHHQYISLQETRAVTLH